MSIAPNTPPELPPDELKRLLKQAAKTMGIEFLDTIQSPDPLALQCVPVEFATAHGLFPIKFRESDGVRRLTVVVSALGDLNLMDTLHYTFKVEVDFVAAEPNEIKRAIRTYYGGK